MFFSSFTLYFSTLSSCVNVSRSGTKYGIKKMGK